MTAVGVDDLIVVETADAVLVAPKSDAQRVKDVVAELASRGRRESNEHLGHISAWGRSTTLEHESTHEVRRRDIAPGEEIALESAGDRAETWIVVSGTAVTSHAGPVPPGRTFASPHGQWTLANHAEEPLVVITVTVFTSSNRDASGGGE